MSPKPTVEAVPTSTGVHSALVDVEADAVFATLTDLARLPTWNEKMVRVVALPDRIEPGAEWVVEFAMFGRQWKSRSRVAILDAATHRFEYRTQTDDGNASFTDWRWRVEPEGVGSRVSVSWELHPRTFWRRVFFSRVRARQLARTEVPASLATLAKADLQIRDKPSR